MKTGSRHLMTAAICMLAAVVGLGGTAQLGAAVVCVGFDGHVDVESSPCTCCIANASHDEGVRFGQATTSPECSDCVGVPLKAPPFKSKEPQLFTPRMNAEGRTAARICDGGWRNNLLVPADPMDQYWRSLSLLSTVVLLT
jgi:hypothetical protein